MPNRYFDVLCLYKAKEWILAMLILSMFFIRIKLSSLNTFVIHQCFKTFINAKKKKIYGKKQEKINKKVKRLVIYLKNYDKYLIKLMIPAIEKFLENSLIQGGHNPKD